MKRLLLLMAAAWIGSGGVGVSRADDPPPVPNPGLQLDLAGAASGLQTSSSWSFGSTVAGTEFGYSVSTAGDVDGDGYHDVVVGTVFSSRVYVYHGSPSGRRPRPIWSSSGARGSRSAMP